MQALAVFDWAFRQNDWLSQRQAVIAGNIANANTPGFKAKDVADFEMALKQSAAAPLTATSASHILPADAPKAFLEKRVDGAEVLHSGNSVNIEAEFLKAGDVMRSYSMNTQVVKSFNRMLLLAAKV